MAWRQGASPPGDEPADRASHLGSREAATGPSIPAPCPLGLQPARQTGRAGGDQRSSLARQAGACFDDSSIQWGQKCAWFTSFNATVRSQSCNLTGHRCIPTVALRPQITPSYFYINKYVFHHLLPSGEWSLSNAALKRTDHQTCHRIHRHYGIF